MNYKDFQKGHEAGLQEAINAVRSLHNCAKNAPAKEERQKAEAYQQVIDDLEWRKKEGI